MKKIVLLLLILLFATPILAKEIPVNIKADKLKYIEDTGRVIASGSVTIDIEGAIIKADQLLMDTNSNVVTAEGNVRIEFKDYQATSSFLTYNISDETSSYYDFKSKASPSNIKGNIYLGAEKITDYKDHMSGREGSMTTCDQAEHDRPHYFTIARRVEYYPDDKIIGFGVTFYECWLGKVPVLWAPYVLYDLKRKQRRNWVVGYNEVEGNFIKTSWDWPKGEVYIDYMDRKGPGIGVLYEYKLKNKDPGSLYLYHVREKDTGYVDWVTKLNQQFSITQHSTLSLTHNSTAIYLVPSGRADQTNTRFEFNHSKGKRNVSATLDVLDTRIGQREEYALNLSHVQDRFKTNYYVDLKQGKVAPRYINNSQRFSHSQPFLKENMSLSTNLNYSNNIARVGMWGDERLDAQYEIKIKGEKYSASLYENWYFDLDQDLYTADSGNQYVERQPELTLSLNPIDLILFNLTPQLGYGWFREVKYVSALGENRDFATGRYKASLNANKTIPLILGTSLSLSTGIDQFTYEPGDAMYSFREGAGLNTDLLAFFKNKIDYRRGISEGNSPFFFDQMGTKYHDIKEYLTLYHEDKINWKTETGYNFETEKYFNVMTRLNLKPDNRLRLHFKTGYDIENKRYLDLSSTAKLRPWEKISGRLEMTHDINIGRLKSANSLLDLEISDEDHWQSHWHVKLGHVYNPSTGEYKLRDIMLVKDLHCWEVRYTYSDYRKEFSVVMTLKALPDEPFGYAPGRGFYFEGFERTVSEFKSESPRRN